jgi:hypothetical protein
MVFPLVQQGFQKSQRFCFDRRSCTNGKILRFARGVNEEGPLLVDSSRSQPVTRMSASLKNQKPQSLPPPHPRYSSAASLDAGPLPDSQPQTSRFAVSRAVSPPAFHPHAGANRAAPGHSQGRIFGDTRRFSGFHFIDQISGFLRNTASTRHLVRVRNENYYPSKPISKVRWKSEFRYESGSDW